jgi:hypothetical protein
MSPNQFINFLKFNITIQNSKKQVFMIKPIFKNILYVWQIGLYLHIPKIAIGFKRNPLKFRE